MFENCNILSVHILVWSAFCFLLSRLQSPWVPGRGPDHGGRDPRDAPRDGGARAQLGQPARRAVPGDQRAGPARQAGCGRAPGLRPRPAHN